MSSQRTSLSGIFIDDLESSERLNCFGYSVSTFFTGLVDYLKKLPLHKVEKGVHLVKSSQGYSDRTVKAARSVLKSDAAFLKEYLPDEKVGDLVTAVVDIYLEEAAEDFGCERIIEPKEVLPTSMTETAVMRMWLLTE